MSAALALDLDDLIFPFMDEFVPFLNRRLDTSFHAEDFFTFDFERVLGGTRDDAIAHVFEYFDHYGDRPHPQPIEGAYDAVQKLAQRYELMIVTSRADELRTVTEAWVEAMFPSTFAHVHLCNNYAIDGRSTVRSKVEVVEQFDAIGLVDDGLHNVIEVADRGRRGLLFGDFAWNRDLEVPENVTRVRTWDDVLHELLGDDA